MAHTIQEIEFKGKMIMDLRNEVVIRGIQDVIIVGDCEKLHLLAEGSMCGGRTYINICFCYIA
jgi:hypothetical protein